MNIKPDYDKETNAVDYFNEYGTWEEVFKNQKDYFIEKNNLKYQGNIVGELNKKLIVKAKCTLTIRTYTKFMAFSKLQHKSNNHSAISFIERNHLHKDLSFIRVGTDYFKIIQKPDRYGIQRTILKSWKKEEIKQDHDKSLLSYVSKLDDFCIEPDNINHQEIVNNCYNLYSKFSHLPKQGEFKTSHSLMQHIFGSQIEIGYQYLKLLYENPRQMLPVLCLVSTERQTGKTTFLNWLNMIFGDNYCLINPEDLASQFNSSYAYKNIIAIDETVIDRIASVEKLKSIATAKSISVNQKFVANYQLPFFGKIIICTNKEKDFMRIDEEEIRFWVRKVHTIPNINTNIENELTSEIPAFLYHLKSLPEINLKKSRMVFTQSQLHNPELFTVKTESWSSLRKDIYILMTKMFEESKEFKIYATPTDLKNHFFSHNNHISLNYISKVLRDEMKLKSEPICRYAPFLSPEKTNTGRPYIFEREMFTDVIIVEENEKNPF